MRINFGARLIVILRVPRVAIFSGFRADRRYFRLVRASQWSEATFAEGDLDHTVRSPELHYCH